MRTLGLCLAFFGACACATAQVNYHPAVPRALMPDGKPFLTWNDVTHYSRTYHVSQNDRQASDQNDGSAEHPFRTIDHAAQVLEPGERVWIHAGIYRELVRPRLGGEGDNKMIAYEAAPGEQVIIRGSRIITTPWVISIDPHNPPGTHPSIYSKQLWMTTLDETFWTAGYNPLQIPNLSNEEIDVMNWAMRWKGRVPYSLPRGMIFQDGRRMVQLATYEDLVRVPGSYWVAPDAQAVHVHPFDGSNPNEVLMEAGVFPHLIQPQTEGLGFIRISGLILEQCANGFARAGVGALFTMGGHHWIIENNTVRHINAVGIEVGGTAYEGPGHPRRETADPGYNIVRGNRVSDCGTAGIRGLDVSHALVEDNEVTDCGWQDAEFHWEVAGIKLLVNRGTLVRNNYIAHLQGSAGIWLDWDNQNSRVTGNMIYDISTAQGAVFIEASHQPNLVDNNVFWKIDGEGVRLADTDNAVVAHNLFGHIAEELIWAKVATDRSVHGRKMTSINNQIVNNIIVAPGKPILSPDPSNVADYNVYVSTKANTDATKDAGPHTVTMHGSVGFDPVLRQLTWEPDRSLPPVPLVRNCDDDWFGRERTTDVNVAGPFLAAGIPTTVKLRTN